MTKIFLLFVYLSFWVVPIKAFASSLYEYEVWIQSEASLDMGEISVAGRIVNTGTVVLDLSAQWSYLGGFPSNLHETICGLDCVHAQLNGQVLDPGSSINFTWFSGTQEEDLSSSEGYEFYGGLGLIPLNSDWHFHTVELNYLAYGEWANGAADTTAFNKATINLDLVGSSIDGTPLSSIPIPTSIWLFSSGLIILTRIFRRGAASRN